MKQTFFVKQTFSHVSVNKTLRAKFHSNTHLIHFWYILKENLNKMNGNKILSLLAFPLVWYLCIGITRIQAQELTRRQILSYLLNSSRYDSNVAPDLDEEYPTNVTIQVILHDMHSISETSMDYSVDIYLRMWWRDDRLDFNEKSNKTKLELDTKNIDNVWQPVIYFENEKRASIHTVTSTNKLMHLHRNGTVTYSIRLSMTLSCAILLHYYPFDSQTCPLLIQSFGYTIDNIDLQWHPTKPIVVEDLIMPQFTLEENEIYTTDFAAYYSQTGTFSTLKAELRLTRKVGFYVLQDFVPSSLLVVLSWVSFWIDPNAVPARVTLGVTCVLTMTTQSSGIQQSLPPVSYVKAIDVWMFVCLLFVFAALLEFAYVNVLLQTKGSEAMALDKENESGSSPDRKNKKKNRSNIFKILCKPAPDGKSKAKRVDIISRFIFPTSFALFLFIFFMICCLAPTQTSGE